MKIRAAGSLQNADNSEEACARPNVLVAARMVFGSRYLRLVYVSAAVDDLSREDLISIGRQARANNASMQVTGLLLHVEGEFFQILEGPSRSVEAIFEKICEDPRNKWVTPLLRERAWFRVFQSWSMGCFDLPFHELPGELFFRADWDEVKLRVKADQRRNFYRFLETFYQANKASGDGVVFTKD